MKNEEKLKKIKTIIKEVYDLKAQRNNKKLKKALEDCELLVKNHVEITIHNVEEKMYSEGEMISFAKYAIKNGFGLNHTENLFIKWIEENL